MPNWYYDPHLQQWFDADGEEDDYDYDDIPPNAGSSD